VSIVAFFSHFDFFVSLHTFRHCLKAETETINMAAQGSYTRHLSVGATCQGAFVATGDGSLTPSLRQGLDAIFLQQPQQAADISDEHHVLFNLTNPIIASDFLSVICPRLNEIVQLRDGGRVKSRSSNQVDSSTVERCIRDIQAASFRNPEEDLFELQAQVAVPVVSVQDQAIQAIQVVTPEQALHRIGKLVSAALKSHENKEDPSDFTVRAGLVHMQPLGIWNQCEALQLEVRCRLARKWWWWFFFPPSQPTFTVSVHRATFHYTNTPTSTADRS